MWYSPLTCTCYHGNSTTISKNLPTTQKAGGGGCAGYLGVYGGGDDVHVGEGVGQCLQAQSSCQHRHKENVLLRNIVILQTGGGRGVVRGGEGRGS